MKRQVTWNEIGAICAIANEDLRTIHQMVADENFGISAETVDYLLGIVRDGGVDMSDASHVAALDLWCLSTIDMSTREEEANRTALYLGLVALGYPAKWHGVLIDEAKGYRHEAPLFHGLESAA